MSVLRNPHLLLAILFAAATGLRDALRGGGLFHVAASVGLVLAATWILYRHLQRPRVALLAAITTSAWLFVQSPKEELLAAAFIPTALLLATPTRRDLGALTAAATGLLLAILLLPREPLPLLVAPLAAAALSLARPTQPTQGAIEALRALCLYLPAGALAVILAWNGAAGFGSRFTATESLQFGLGLLLLLGLVSLGGLGLLTLIESTDRLQVNTWNSYSIVAATLAAAGLALRDPSRTIEFLVLLAPTTAVLTSIVATRIRHALRAPRLPTAPPGGETP